jgi:hypothetical protein
VGASFISQQDLSDRLGRDVTADNGALFAVESACDVVRVVSEQNFDLTTETIVIDGTGTDCLLLPELPALGAGTVVVDGYGTITDYVLADNGRLIRKNLSGTASVDEWWLYDWLWGWPSSPYASTIFNNSVAVPPAPIWPYGRQNVTVTYDHGYAGTAIPQPIREVALSYAARLVTQGAAISETVGAVSVRYAGAAGDLTTTEKLILRKYRPTR